MYGQFVQYVYICVHSLDSCQVLFSLKFRRRVTLIASTFKDSDDLALDLFYKVNFKLRCRNLIQFSIYDIMPQHFHFKFVAGFVNKSESERPG